MAAAELRGHGVIITPTVYVWDENMDLRGTLAQPPAIRDDGSRTISLPLDDDVAVWLLADSRRGAHLTVDNHDGNGRWLGRLDYWKVDRVGPCKECAHCMQPQLTAVWVTA